MSVWMATWETDVNLISAMIITSRVTMAAPVTLDDAHAQKDLREAIVCLHDMSMIHQLLIH